MAYRVNSKDGIRALCGGGKIFADGDVISPTALPPKLWAQLVAEGAVIEDEPQQLEPAPEPVKVEEKPEVAEPEPAPKPKTTRTRKPKVTK